MGSAGGGRQPAYPPSNISNSLVLHALGIPWRFCPNGICAGGCCLFAQFPSIFYSVAIMCMIATACRGRHDERATDRSPWLKYARQNRPASYRPASSYFHIDIIGHLELKSTFIGYIIAVTGYQP